MQIHPVIVITMVVTLLVLFYVLVKIKFMEPAILASIMTVLGLIIWFFTSAEFSSDTGFDDSDYKAPITDQSGGSLSGSNLIVMDATGNMKLAPIDTFNANTKSNLRTIVGDKVPEQLSALNDSIRGGKEGSLKDLYNDLSSGITSNTRAITTNKDTFKSYVKNGAQVSIAMGPGNQAKFDGTNTNRRFLRGTRDNWRVDYRGPAKSENTGHPPLWIVNTVS